MLAARVEPKNGSKETEAGNNLNQDRKSILCPGASPYSASFLTAVHSWTACPVKAGLWPPPPAADGLDRARRPAVVCHHEIDGKLWPSQQFQTAGFRPFSDRC